LYYRDIRLYEDYKNYKVIKPKIRKCYSTKKYQEDDERFRLIDNFVLIMENFSKYLLEIRLAKFIMEKHYGFPWKLGLSESSLRIRVTLSHHLRRFAIGNC